MNPLLPILDLLFPPRCPFCGKIIRETDLCDHCQETLPWILDTTSPAKGEFHEGCYAPLWYKDLVRDSFHRYKFGGRKYYHKLYATLMAQALDGAFTQKPDAICWAPLHPRRLRRRGYDQSKLLAQSLSEQLNIPLVCALEKCRHTRPQSNIADDDEKRANALGAYKMSNDVDVSGQFLLLVDDIYTTGSTLSECARILKTAGATSVVCLTYARAK